MPRHNQLDSRFRGDLADVATASVASAPRVRVCYWVDCVLPRNGILDDFEISLIWTRRMHGHPGKKLRLCLDSILRRPFRVRGISASDFSVRVSAPSDRDFLGRAAGSERSRRGNISPGLDSGHDTSTLVN